MFGPNARSSFDGATYMHHREPAYYQLLESTTQLFRDKFKISTAWDVLFLTGSGTLANEAALWSMRGTGQQLRIDSTHAFGARLKALWQALEPPRLARPNWAQYIWAHVAYETAESLYRGVPWPEVLDEQEGDWNFSLHFADCVSSFPYYMPPESTDIWTTVSSKQLGALPGLSIAVVRKASWPVLRSAEEYSYLNLRRYQEAHGSPHTPAIALLADLRQRLTGFDPEYAAGHINLRRKMLERVFPRKECVIGEGPVLTVKEEYISAQTASEFNLYRSSVGGWQFFLYAGRDDEYIRFCDHMILARQRGKEKVPE